MKTQNKRTNSNHNSTNTKGNTSKSSKDQSTIAQYLQDENNPKPKLEENPIGIPLTMKVLSNSNLPQGQILGVSAPRVLA